MAAAISLTREVVITPDIVQEAADECRAIAERTKGNRGGKAQADIPDMKLMLAAACRRIVEILEGGPPSVEH